jgi:hypothetical protein
MSAPSSDFLLISGLSSMIIARLGLLPPWLLFTAVFVLGLSGAALALM